MMPLPTSDFEPAVWSVAKVPTDYLVSDGRNRYSVPSNLIGERVDIRITRNMVGYFTTVHRSHFTARTERRGAYFPPGDCRVEPATAKQD
jgi:hypothetical protein